MSPFFHFLIFSVITLSVSNDLLNYLEESEIEVMVSIFSRLRIGHGFFVTKFLNSRIFTNVKSIVHLHKIFVSQMGIGHFENFFLSKAGPSHTKIGIFTKATEINVLENAFESDPVKVATFTWIIFTSNNVEYNFKIPYNCEFFTVQNNQSNAYIIKEVYHVKRTGPYVQDFGYWSSPSDYSFNNEGFYIRRKNMKSAQLIRTDNNGFGICYNYSIELKHREIWWEVSRLLNFTQKVVGTKLTNDKITGPDAPDGTSCALGHHAINYFPDVINPTCRWPMHMVIRYEINFGEGWKAYIKPFSNSLWYAILGWLILSSFAFLFMKIYSDSNTEIGIFTPIYCICEQEGILSQSSQTPSSGVRIAYLISCIISRIIVPAFGAAILSILTAQLPKIPFSDLEGFLRDGTYKLGSLNNTFMIMYFKRHTEPLISRIYREKFIDEKEYPNIHEEAEERLCKGDRFAFMSYKEHVIEETLKCRLFKISNPVTTIICGFRMRPGSPFKSVFSESLVTLYNTGIMQRRILTKVIFKREIEKFNKPLSLPQVSAVLSIIPVGLFMALVFLVLEILINKQKR